MLIDSIILENFRGYHSRQVIELSDLTAFVGKLVFGETCIAHLVKSQYFLLLSLTF